MNRLSNSKRAQILQTICEGNSLRATARLTGAAFNTVLKLQVALGQAAEYFHNSAVRNIASKHVECDELWSFCHTKRANLSKHSSYDCGDVYTWVAIDPETKLVISWCVGTRNTEDGIVFMDDLASRLGSPSVKISTDALGAYAIAVDNSFGGEAVHNISKKHTSHVERNNLNIRMGNRRFTRSTNAFSKKRINHAMSTALYFVFYNFCRPHLSLDPLTTPAMAAGLTKFPMTIEGLSTALLSK